MPHDEPDVHAPTHDTAVQAPRAPVYEPLAEQQDWLEEPHDSELPPRPRRRLLGTGGNPIQLAMFGVLLIACGFIAGALVEKDQTTTTSSGATGGAASRFAALRSSAAGGTSAGNRLAGSSGARSLAGGSARAGGAGATVGQVAYVSGHTLYVTNFEGNTVKVTTSGASTVSKTVKADVKSIHPGETVVVTGSPAANGAISAESIRVGEAGGGGPSALFGARGAGLGGVSSRHGGAGGGGEPALFGG